MTTYTKEPVQAMQVDFAATIHFDGGEKHYGKGWWIVQNADGSQHILRDREFRAMYTETKGT